jgi:hypothetical protein
MLTVLSDRDPLCTVSCARLPTNTSKVALEVRKTTSQSPSEDVHRARHDYPFTVQFRLLVIQAQAFAQHFASEEPVRIAIKNGARSIWMNEELLR